MLLALALVPAVGGMLFVLARWEEWALRAPVRPLPEDRSRHRA